jgi:outer membrane protein TolC
MVLAGSRISQAQSRFSPNELQRSERALAQEATLNDVLQLALARNPELGEAADRARAAVWLGRSAARWPEPELEYQLWAAPLDRPYALDEAEMHMFGVRQTIPAPGTLSARADAGSARASMAHAAKLARELELRERVRRAFAEYRRAESEYRLHLEHVRLASEIMELVQATYRAGRGSQQDVLRTMVELSRLHSDVAAIDRDRRSVRGLLNTLMARPLEAPLGPPAAVDARQVTAEADALLKAVKPSSAEQRPEVAAAESAIRSNEAALAEARASARWPSFMVGVQYMYMPPEADPHNYGVMFSMTLPWLNPRYQEEVNARSAMVAAGRNALASARFTARYELYDAMRRLEAARESLVILARDLSSQAQASFESARAVYGAGQSDSLALLDTLRTWLDVRIQRERAQAQLETALADVELALGTPIRPEETVHDGTPSMVEHD